jgi:DNA-binding CsgD family transcriptional regulator
LRRANRRADARELLREGLDVAHHAGAAPLADRAEAELRATGAKPRRVALSGVEALTASERRVAELAGDGLTNREIAQALFVTMRTVEGHLTRVSQARPRCATSCRRSCARG